MRCVIVRRLEELPDEAVPGLVEYVGTPSPDVALVLHHTGGMKGKAVLDKLRKGGATEVKAASPKKWELPGWLQAEFRSHKKKIDKDGATALVDALGEDMRALAGAASQLATDCGDDVITPQTVRAYFGGRADVKGFAVADAAIDGKTTEAMEQLRWAIGGRVDPVLITSAMASGLRAPGPLPSGASRPPRSRSGPRGRRTPVEAEVDRRAVAVMVVTRAGHGDPGRRAGRRRRQGRGG